MYLIEICAMCIVIWLIVFSTEGKDRYTCQKCIIARGTYLNWELEAMFESCKMPPSTVAHKLPQLCPKINCHWAGCTEHWQKKSNKDCGWRQAYPRVFASLAIMNESILSRIFLIFPNLPKKNFQLPNFSPTFPSCAVQKVFFTPSYTALFLLHVAKHYV